MKLYLACFTLAACAAIGRAQDQPAAAPADAGSYTVGGTALAVPSPVADWKSGDDYSKVMELFVPATNRLVTSFLAADDIARLNKGDTSGGFTKYAVAEVNRAIESTDIGADDFKQLTGALAQQFGADLSSSVKDMQDEVNQRLKSLDVGKLDVSLDKPYMLGTFFSKDDEMGFGLVESVKAGDSTAKMVGGCAVVRVKQRVLFLYLFAQYEDEKTVAWVRANIEKWADAVLKANTTDAGK